MPIAQNGNVQIHYRDRGDGEDVIVLLQGLGLSGRFWFGVPDLIFEQIDRPLRVICIDNRGSGQSDAPSTPWRMRDMADDVAAVLQHAGVASAVIVGISMGGMIAQQFAIHHSEKICGLVLIATSPGIPHGRLPRWEMLKSLIQVPFVEERKARQLLGTLLLPKAERAHIAIHLQGWREAFLEEGASSQSFLLQFGAILTHVIARGHRQIQCPTTILTGTEDILVPPINGEILSRLIPHARFRRLPNVAHCVPALAADAIVAAVAQVLGVRGDFEQEAA